MAVFEVLGASVVGPRHVAEGTACQDSFATATGEDWAVAVVSDGAGSAKRAADGARIVCETLCEALVDAVEETPVSGALSDLSCARVEEIVRAGIELARRRCLSDAKNGESLSAFHATVVGGVVRNSDGILFHIGDGGASAYRRTLAGHETVGFSPPENGEYLNETFFFTERDWRRHLRLTVTEAAPDAVWLMTDGAYGLVIPWGTKGIRDLTAREFDRLLFQQDAADREETLATLLSLPQAESLSDDDKTIVIVRRKGT